MTIHSGSTWGGLRSGSSLRLAALGVVVAALAACPGDDEDGENVLPTAGGTSADGSTTDDPSGTSVGETDAGPVVPAAYRFDCVDIQMVGSADGDAITAQLLENTWGSDIENFKLNIVLDVMSRDEGGGEAQIGIRSGVGTAPGDLCNHPDTQTEPFAVSYEAETTTYAPASGDGECSTMQTGTGEGTYTLSLPSDFVAYIYAEDDDGTTFNCTPDDALPDAVPIRAIEAEVSTDASAARLAGNLTACLTQAEAQNLCSCLGECVGAMGPDDRQTEGNCAGCPVGAVTLDQLLGGVDTSANCTEKMGEPAFDLQIGFTASRLPNIPATCG